MKFFGSYPAAGEHATSAREHADARWRQADDWVAALRTPHRPLNRRCRPGRGRTVSRAMSDAPVSVVTGANSGIGRATAIHLAQQGHRVFGTVRATSRMDTFHKLAEAAGVDIELVELDVAEDDSVARGFEEIFAKTDRVDVLVNNAGIGGNAVAEEATPELYLDVMNVNLCGAIRCLKHVLPGMRERRSGAIVNITSLTGQGGGDRPVAVRGVEVRVRGRQRRPRPGAGAVRHPGRDHRARRDEVGDLRQERRRAERRPAPTTPRTGGCSSSTPAASPRRPTRWRSPRSSTTPSRPTSRKLRYAMSWGGQGMVDGREAMSDAEWVELGAIEDDAEYYARFQEHFGVDISARPERTDVSASECFVHPSGCCGGHPPETLRWDHARTAWRSVRPRARSNSR